MWILGYAWKVRGGAFYISEVIGVTWNSAGDDNVAGAVHQPAHVHGGGGAERRRLAVIPDTGQADFGEQPAS